METKLGLVTKLVVDLLVIGNKMGNQLIHNWIGNQELIQQLINQ